MRLLLLTLCIILLGGKLSPGRTPQISAVTEDKKGNLWIGTIEGGLYQMNPETEAVQHYAFTPHSSTSILSNNVNGILIDSDNHLWAYTWGLELVSWI